MRLLPFVVALSLSLELIAGNGKRCATTEHMQYVRAKNANEHPNVNFPASNPVYVPRTDAIYYIPVVVHVLWNTTGQNISDAQINSQIDVLNEDYGRTNANASATPAAFAQIASGTNFRFCLAHYDPSGNITTGIERRQTTKTEFQTDDQMKHFSMGGLNQWDPDRYLNIWVCNLGPDILGYAETPDVVPHTNTFGVVIAYNAFGRMGTATSPYDLGRTTTHEIGHCFNLWHIWGDDNGTCGGQGDLVGDTPDQANETYNCVNFPKLDTCSPNYPGIMFMNYMDYSDDDCMSMFSAGQAVRMYNEIWNYYPLLLSSGACTTNGIGELSSDFNFSVYPNPSNGKINIDLTATKYLGEELKISLFNTLGEIIFADELKNAVRNIYNIDLSDQSSGLYFLTLTNEKYRRSIKLILK
jgi:hypothetical protein